MSSHLLRIDPTFPLCWESTDTLRIGFDRAEALLHRPSAAAQRYLSRLTEGILSTEQHAIAHRCGLSAAERQRLLRVLEPVLERIPVAPVRALELGHGGATSTTAGTEFSVSNRTVRVRVLGGSDFSGWLASALSAGGVDARAVPERRGVNAGRGTEEETDLGGVDYAVLVENFLQPASRAQHLLRLGIPHLPVRLTDRSMSLGPFVVQAASPCLACVQLHDVATDPLSAVLASQLGHVLPSTATEACAKRAGALILGLIEHWRRGVPELAATRLRYPVRDGLVGLAPDIERLVPHHDCACVALAA